MRAGVLFHTVEGDDMAKQYLSLATIVDSRRNDVAVSLDFLKLTPARRQLIEKLRQAIQPLPNVELYTLKGRIEVSIIFLGTSEAEALDFVARLVDTQTFEIFRVSTDFLAVIPDFTDVRTYRRFLIAKRKRLGDGI